MRSSGKWFRRQPPGPRPGTAGPRRAWVGPQESTRTLGPGHPDIQARVPQKQSWDEVQLYGWGWLRVCPGQGQNQGGHGAPAPSAGLGAVLTGPSRLVPCLSPPAPGGQSAALPGWNLDLVGTRPSVWSPLAPSSVCVCLCVHVCTRPICPQPSSFRHVRPLKRENR